MKNLFKRKRFYLIISFILIAAAVFFLKGFLLDNPEITEYKYSRTIFKFISQSLSFIFGLFPFSMAEVLIVSAVIFSVIYLISASVRSVKRTRLEKKELRLLSYKDKRRFLYNFIIFIISLIPGIYLCIKYIPPAKSLTKTLIIIFSICLITFFILYIMKAIIRSCVRHEKLNELKEISYIHPLKPLINFTTYILCLACGLYSCFYIFWGFNYGRQSLEISLGYTNTQTYDDELKDLCIELAAEINRLRPLVSENEQGIMKLNGSDTDVLNRASVGYINLAQSAEKYEYMDGIYCRPQYLLSSVGYCYMKITGVFIPYTMEANINKYTPDCSKPNTIMHEMAHQRGFAAEDEANFIAFLACKEHDDIDFQYSGYYLAFIHSINELNNYDSDAVHEIYSTLCDGYKRDAISSIDFWAQFDGPVEEIADDVNDSYLQSNGVEDGVKSYSRMVELLLAEKRNRDN